jgi:hypothetical protein
VKLSRHFLLCLEHFHPSPLPSRRVRRLPREVGSEPRNVEVINSG